MFHAGDDLDFTALYERGLLLGTHVEGSVELFPQLKGLGRELGLLGLYQLHERQPVHASHRTTSSTRTTIPAVLSCRSYLVYARSRSFSYVGRRVEGWFIHFPASRLPRIPLLGTSVNKTSPTSAVI